MFSFSFGHSRNYSVNDGWRVEDEKVCFHFNNELNEKLIEKVLNNNIFCHNLSSCFQVNVPELKSHKSWQCSGCHLSCFSCCCHWKCCSCSCCWRCYWSCSCFRSWNKGKHCIPSTPDTPTFLSTKIGVEKKLDSSVCQEFSCLSIKMWSKKNVITKQTKMGSLGFSRKMRGLRPDKEEQRIRKVNL